MFFYLKLLSLQNHILTTILFVEKKVLKLEVKAKKTPKLDPQEQNASVIPFSSINRV